VLLWQASGPASHTGQMNDDDDLAGDVITHRWIIIRDVTEGGMSGIVNSLIMVTSQTTKLNAV